MSIRVSSVLPSFGEMKKGDIIKNTKEIPAVTKIIFIAFLAISSVSILFHFSKIMTSRMIIIVVGAILIDPSHIKRRTAAKIANPTVEKPIINFANL